jgi:hypothetical protein
LRVVQDLGASGDEDESELRERWVRRISFRKALELGEKAFSNPTSTWIVLDRTQKWIEYK